MSDREKLQIAINGLHAIASWSEGAEVSCGFDEPCGASRARATLAEIGIDGPPPPVPRSLRPVVIRSNAKGTVNRAQLRRLVQEGRVEARLDYSYDEMTGTRSGTEWLPALFGPDDIVPRPGLIVFDEHDFGSSSGKAYLREDRDDPGHQQVILRVHSNLIYELRVRP